jgi:hypothetical protein
MSEDCQSEESFSIDDHQKLKEDKTFYYIFTCRLLQRLLQIFFFWFRWTFVLFNVNYYKDYYKYLKSNLNRLINVITTSNEKIIFEIDSRRFLESVSALNYCDRSKLHDQWSHENVAYVSMSWFIHKAFVRIYN